MIPVLDVNRRRPLRPKSCYVAWVLAGLGWAAFFLSLLFR